MKINSVIAYKNHGKLALVYFGIIAILGAILRWFPLIDFSFDYKFLVHAHSHVALLGWVYTALTTLMYYAFLSEAGIELKYKRLFWFTQLTILGMLLSFPFTGYALLSIVFSTLFLLASYMFTFWFIKHTNEQQKRKLSYQCFRMALWFMITSSLGPWALGIIMNTLGSSSSWYRNAIYFYLHFQYNGWFLLALFGLFFYVLESKSIQINYKAFRLFFRSFNFGVVLTFAISLLWMKPEPLVYAVAVFGAGMQIFALVPFFKTYKSNKVLKDIYKRDYSVLKVIGIFYILKLISQFIGSMPFVSEMIASNVYLVIGYLHWIFLGVVSLSIFLYLKRFEFITVSKRMMQFYIAGFLVTEGLIFYKGLTNWLSIAVPNFELYLAIASSLFGCIILVIVISQYIKSSSLKSFAKR